MIVSKGSGAHMLKIGSKRRRTKQQIHDEKEAAAEEKAEIERKIAAYNSLKAEHEKLKAVAKNNDAAASILSDLISKRHVVQLGDGSCHVPSADNSMQQQQP